MGNMLPDVKHRSFRMMQHGKIAYVGRSPPLRLQANLGMQPPGLAVCSLIPFHTLLSITCSHQMHANLLSAPVYHLTLSKAAEYHELVVWVIS